MVVFKHLQLRSACPWYGILSNQKPFNTKEEISEIRVILWYSMKFAKQNYFFGWGNMRSHHAPHLTQIPSIRPTRFRPHLALAWLQPGGAAIAGGSKLFLNRKLRKFRSWDKRIRKPASKESSFRTRMCLEDEYFYISLLVRIIENKRQKNRKHSMQAESFCTTSKNMHRRLFPANSLIFKF